jgi:hypothetical protein
MAPFRRPDFTLQYRAAMAEFDHTDLSLRPLCEPADFKMVLNFELYVVF